MRESMQVTIATPAWATPSKPDEVEWLRELAVGREEVVEVVSHGGNLVGDEQAWSAVTSAWAPGKQEGRRAPPRRRHRPRRQTKMAWSWAMPASSLGRVRRGTG